MNKKELLKMVEDEVAGILNTPLREPGGKENKKIQYRPVLQNEEDIDDMLFYVGNAPEEVKKKRKKNNKKLLGFGK